MSDQPVKYCLRCGGEYDPVWGHVYCPGYRSVTQSKNGAPPPDAVKPSSERPTRVIDQERRPSPPIFPRSAPPRGFTTVDGPFRIVACIQCGGPATAVSYREPPGPVCDAHNPRPQITNTEGASRVRTGPTHDSYWLCGVLIEKIDPEPESRWYERPILDVESA